MLLSRPVWYGDVVYFFFSLTNLCGRLVDRHQILTHVWPWPEFIKLGQKFGDLLPKNWQPKNIQVN